MKKDAIPLYVKKEVWIRDSHSQDRRIAQCKTCNGIVKNPQSLNKYIINSSELLPYEFNIKGVGEFGHIVPEKYGGKATFDNLFIQCKECNTKLGANKMVFSNYNDDVLMLDVDAFNEYSMEVESKRCIAILKNGNQCKNKSLPNRSYCHIHLNN